MEELFKRYHRALKAYLVRRRKVTPSEVDEVVDGFVASQMWERDLLARADPKKGRFRTLLLTALRRYTANWLRHRRALRRSGGLPPPADIHSTPVAAPPTRDAFEVEWARSLLNQTIRRMHEHCITDNRLDIWRVFEARLLKPLLDQQPAPSYADLCRELGLKRAAQASNLLTTATRMYDRILRNVIGEYAGSEEEIDREIDDLMKTFERGA